MHRLAGAVEKFNRSQEQFDALRAEMDAFFNTDPRPHSSMGGFDPDAWEWIERFQIREPPPLRFGVILGDCVHNLRSCLDHVLWQVTLLDGGTPDRYTQYPIATESEAQFERMAKRRIAGLSPRHRAMVRETQPYHRGDEAATHPLAILANLSNTDKHQVVHTAFSIVGYDAAATLAGLVRQDSEDRPSPVEGWWLASDGRLDHDSPWFRIVWRRGEEPPTKVQLRGDMRTETVFGDVGLPASEFPKIADAVRTIVEAFMREFPETEYVDDPKPPDAA
jgi:hypothetical protein